MKSYACGEAAGFFVTDPTKPLTATVAKLDAGCANLQLRSKTTQEGAAAEVTLSIHSNVSIYCI